MIADVENYFCQEARADVMGKYLYNRDIFNDTREFGTGINSDGEFITFFFHPALYIWINESDMPCFILLHIAWYLCTAIS